MSTTQDQPGLRDRVRRRPVLFGGIAVVAIVAAVVVLVVFQPQRLLYDEVVDEDFPVAGSASEADGSMADPSDDTVSGGSSGQQDDPPEGGGDAMAGDAAEGGGDAMAGDAAEGGGDAMAGDAADGGGDAADGGSDAASRQTEPSGPVALASGDFSSRSRYSVTGVATVYELEDGARTLRLEDFESTNGPDLFVYLTAADADAPDPELDADYVDLGALRGNVGNQNYEVPEDVDLDVHDTVVIWCRPFSVAFGAADLF